MPMEDLQRRARESLVSDHRITKNSKVPAENPVESLKSRESPRKAPGILTGTNGNRIRIVTKIHVQSPSTFHPKTFLCNCWNTINLVGSINPCCVNELRIPLKCKL